MMIAEEMMRHANGERWSRKHKKLLLKWARQVADVEWDASLMEQEFVLLSAEVESVLRKFGTDTIAALVEVEVLKDQLKCTHESQEDYEGCPTCTLRILSTVILDLKRQSVGFEPGSPVDDCLLVNKYPLDRAVEIVESHYNAL